MAHSAFSELYSTHQMQQFQKVRDALVADPKALDNRGDAADSVSTFAANSTQQDTGNGHS
jgi:hypothetical protein